MDGDSVEDLALLIGDNAGERGKLVHFEACGSPSCIAF